MNRPNPRRGWKRALTWALKIGFSGGLVAWVLHKTNLASIGDSLASASPEWLALALAMGIAGTMVQAKQWQRLLLAVGLRRSITRCLRIVFVGNTFNALLPSSIGGDASRAVYIAERQGERAPAAASVALQRLLNFPGMVLLMGFGLALTITSTAAARARPLALAGAAIGLIILGITISPLIGRIAASTRLARLPGWKPISTSLRVLDGFRSQRAELVAASGRGALFWSLTVLNQWAYIRAVGIHPSLGYSALAVTLVNLATMLPLSVNGFGAREGGYIALLAGVGLATTAQAASVGLLITAQSLLFGLIGAGCLLTLRSTARWARRVDAGTTVVVTRLYAPARWLNARPLLVTFGASRTVPERAAASTDQIVAVGRDGSTGHGAPAGRDGPQTEPARASRAELSSTPDEVRGLHQGVTTMRVMMVAPEPIYTPRGTPIAVLNRCRALTALGHQVDLVTYPIGQDVVVPGLRFVRTPRLPGLRQVKIGPSLAKLPLDALLLWTAVRQLRRCRYDVIHTVEEAGAAGWLLRAIFRQPYVHDVHSDLGTVLGDYGFGERHPVVLLARWVERHVLAGAKVIIVNFPGMMPLVTAQTPRTPVHVINCVSVTYQVDPALSDKLRSNWGRDRPVILYTGSFEPYQGLPLLLEAMAVVRDSLPQARLALVGGRPEQVTEITQQAAQLGIAEAVICTGQCSVDEIPSYLAAADVLVSPRRAGINTPCKLYDYLRAGKPIVATHTASHLDVLDDQCAVLAEPTPQDFAAALLAVLNDAALSDRLSLAATKRAHDFGAGPFLRQTAAAYRELGVPAPSEETVQAFMASLGEVASPAGERAGPARNEPTWSSGRGPDAAPN